MDFLGNYDVVVVGAGHAGIEAAHAAAMLGAKTAIFTLTLDFIGNMPCNPSIGALANGLAIVHVLDLHLLDHAFLSSFRALSQQ